MNKLFLPALALSAILMTPSADATTSQAKAGVLRTAQALKRQGISFRSHYWHGLLRRKGSTTIKTTLKENTEYILVGGGCSDAYDVDITIYDHNWKEVGHDSKIDATPTIKITPVRTGRFYIKVKMTNSTSNGAHYALIIGYNP